MVIPVLISDIRPGVNSSDPRDMTWVGNKVFFTAGVDGSADQNRELWVTDGTEAGTEMVRDIYVGDNASNPGWLTGLGSKLYFVASDGVHGNELWVSDGTSSGTKMLGDIQVGSDGSEPKSLFAYGNKLYFSAEKNGDRELWRYDPLHEDLELFYDINDPFRNRLDDGVFDQESGYPQDFAVIGDELWFVADDGIHGRELWKTDGTKEGTAMVVDLTTKSSNSAISDLVEMGGYAFFVASSDDRGREVFRSDGTPEGTVMLKDIALRSSANPEDLTVCNGLLFFSADAAHLMTGRELYVSDGTMKGTTMLKDINLNGTGLVSRITAVGDSIFFVASNGVTGVELWRSDGTTEGTVLVKDIEPGSDSSLPQDLIDANGILYFKADDGTHGFELWKSDGTEAGTLMVSDLYEDEADGEPEGLTVASVAPSNGFQVASPALFFAGYQRENNVVTGNELWKLPLPNGDVLSSSIPSVEGPGAGFVIDASKPVISLASGTETSSGNWRIHVNEGVKDVALVVADENVSWDLVAGGDAQNFVLDPVTGELSFAAITDFDQPIDLDADNVYNVGVQAEDLAGNTSVASLEVRVSEVAEGGIPFDGPGAGFVIDAGKPVISFPAGTEISSGNWRIYVDEGVTDVAPVLADEVVSWDLVIGGDAQSFVLDPVTGELSFAAVPDFDQPSDLDADNIYNVDLQAEDSSGNASLASIEVRVSPVIEGGITLLSKGGKKPLKGTPGPDTFILKKRNLFGRRWATRLRDFSCAEGDRLVFKGGMRKKLPSLSDASFLEVKSKSHLRNASKRDIDFIYFEPKGALYYNQNLEKKGYGSGGLMMMFKGEGSDFEIGCMTDLV